MEERGTKKDGEVGGGCQRHALLSPSPTPFQVPLILWVLTTDVLVRAESCLVLVMAGWARPALWGDPG